MSASPLIAFVLDDLPRLAGYLFIALLLLGVPMFQLLRQHVDRWLEGRFEGRLQAMREADEQQRRHTQITLDRELDRVLRMQRRTSDVAAQSWDRVYDAYWRARGTVSRLHAQHEFSRMGLVQQDDFIRRSRLAGWQKDELLLLGSANERSAYYRRARRLLSHQRAEDARLHALSFIERNAIHVPDELKNLFLELNALIAAALLEEETNIDARPESQEHRMAERLASRGEALMAHLESRLHDLL